jgi:hypothetical protein
MDRPARTGYKNYFVEATIIGKLSNNTQYHCSSHGQILADDGFVAFA